MMGVLVRIFKAALQGKQPKRLLPFVGHEHQAKPKGLMFAVQDYLTLVDDTGRAIHDDKRGVIQLSTTNILHRLNIPLENWLKITHEFKYLFTGPVGTLEDLTRYCARLGKKRVAHANSCRHWQR